MLASAGTKDVANGRQRFGSMAGGDILDILPCIGSYNMGQKCSRVLVFRVFSNNKSTCERTEAVGGSGSLLTARIKADPDGFDLSSLEQIHEI